MKTFNEFVLEWWNEYLQTITEDAAREIMIHEFLGRFEKLEDFIPSPNLEVESCREWLSFQDNGNYIFQKLFRFWNERVYNNLPDKQTFLVDAFLQAATWYDGPDASQTMFIRDFVFEMAYKASGYTDPKSYFEDLQHGGCQSGFVNMLIYNSDCKTFYINNIDEMEEYIEQIEESIGEPLKNKQRLPHYTFVCWACFEELGHTIARNLWPNIF